MGPRTPIRRRLIEPQRQLVALEGSGMQFKAS